MKTRRRFAFAAFLLLVQLAGFSAVRAAETIPTQLSDQEFWKLSNEFSEIDGTFRSDNLLSNELYMQYVIPELTRIAKPGGVYLGVGPEQNFTYIAATRPAMVFIVDIRRGNMDLHLLYKALFELSHDRVEFVARLFARPRPPAVPVDATINDIFQAIDAEETSEATFTADLRDVMDHLTKTRHLPSSWHRWSAAARMPASCSLPVG